MEENYFVYIMANKRNGTIYIGCTNDLVRRVFEHKNEFVPGFSNRYKTQMLVHYENAGSKETALNRERLLKR